MGIWGKKGACLPFAACFLAYASGNFFQGPRYLFSKDFEFVNLRLVILGLGSQVSILKGYIPWLRYPNQRLQALWVQGQIPESDLMGSELHNPQPGF